MEIDYCGSLDSINYTYTKALYDEENKALFANSCASWKELMTCWQERECVHFPPDVHLDIDNLGFTWFIDSVDDLNKTEEKNIKLSHKKLEENTRECPICTLHSFSLYNQILENIWSGIKGSRRTERFTKLQETECGRNESLHSMLVEKLVNCASALKSTLQSLTTILQQPKDQCETHLYK
ncbi:hypothetical protein PoB_001072400 [Plakobranchus ocellatus]|uniref:Uncharacterized protein n=1 Tax=Plakobranchus ocellatus TaxID=259542 RepID=A0AAV3YQB0_9GAST|nr:hypothetical protein PoB_001072400 [Plakobranchus ocellatus]